MPLLGALRLRGGKSKKSTSETTTTTQPSSPPSTPTTPTTATVTDKKLPRRPRPHSIASSTSLNMFRKKERSDLDSVEGWHPDLDISSEMEGGSRHALNSQSVSATNGLAALRINTPNSFRPSTETARRSTVSRDTTTDERNVLNT